jgi:hypothetical protein
MSNLDWKQPDPAMHVSGKAEPLSAEEIQQLDSYADVVLASLRKRDPGFDYDMRTVKLLSDSINAERAGYDEEQTVKIGNLYGAFLGKAILATCAQLKGQWVRADDSIGVRFERGQQVRIAFPLTRVFKQIEVGEAASIFDFLASIEEFATADPA